MSFSALSNVLSIPYQFTRDAIICPAKNKITSVFLKVYDIAAHPVNTTNGYIIEPVKYSCRCLATVAREAKAQSSLIKMFFVAVNIGALGFGLFRFPNPMFSCVFLGFLGNRLMREAVNNTNAILQWFWEARRHVKCVSISLFGVPAAIALPVSVPITTFYFALKLGMHLAELIPIEPHSLDAKIIWLKNIITNQNQKIELLTSRISYLEKDSAKQAEIYANQIAALEKKIERRITALKTNNKRPKKIIIHSKSPPISSGGRN